MNQDGTLEDGFSFNPTPPHCTPSFGGMLSYSPTASITTIIAFVGSPHCEFSSSVCLKKSGVSCKYVL